MLVSRVVFCRDITKKNLVENPQSRSFCIYPGVKKFRFPAFRDFRYFSIWPKIENPNTEFLGSGLGISKKSHPEANSAGKYPLQKRQAPRTKFQFRMHEDEVWEIFCEYFQLDCLEKNYEFQKD